MKLRSTIKWMLIYGLLIVGSAVFSLPFVWMACTSVKVDREVFAKELRLLPVSPHPRVRSPYIDDDCFWPQQPPSQALLDGLETLARDRGVQLPPDIPEADAWRQITMGLYDRLTRTLPKEVLDGGANAVLAAAARQIDAPAVSEALGEVHRRLLLGQIRVRSQQLVDRELGSGLAADRRLENLTPREARLINWTDRKMDCTSVDYDFSQGHRVVLAGTFELPFDGNQFQRLQISIRPDDTWHELSLTMERGGRRYRASRSVAMANFTWLTITWQMPSEDDQSNKIKTWLVLEDCSAPGVRYLDEPNQIKLTFELAQVSESGAWWNKLKLNYQRVLDHMPLGRYLCTSLFLVIVNIVLTVFSCSLVAYSFARLQWPGRNFCFVLMLATMMIPGQVTMIPHFLIWKSLGAYDTLTPLWLGSALGSAFFIFLLRQFLKGIPRDLEDAARIDGCGFWRIYWHIMLPLVKPSLAAIAIFTFMGTWNDFMGTLLYVADQRLYPLAFGMYAFSVQVSNNPLLTMAGSLLMTVPVIIIFFFAQKYFIQGITLTGMKG